MKQGQGTIEDIIKSAIDQLRSFSSISFSINEIKETLGDTSKKSKLEVEKEIFKYFANRLRQHPHENTKYDVDKIPQGLWEPFAKVVTAVRVQELKDVKVVRRRGKYDIKELRNSYYGERILDDLEHLGKRWMLKKNEFQDVKIQCRKLNLTLPEVIEPTTTEKFFEDDM